MLLYSRFPFIAQFRCFPSLSAAVVGICPTIRVPNERAWERFARTRSAFLAATVRCPGDLSRQKWAVLISHARLHTHLPSNHYTPKLCQCACLRVTLLPIPHPPTPSSPPPSHRSSFPHRPSSPDWLALSWAIHGVVFVVPSKETGDHIGTKRKKLSKQSAIPIFPQYPVCGSVRP